MRLFPTRFMRWSCYAVAGILTAWWLAVLLVTIFQCQPVEKAFDPYMTTGYCIDSIRFYKAMIIPNIITDIIIFCLPVYEVRKLHLPRGQRVGLASVFLLGAFAIIASAIRLWYNNKLAADGTADLTREYHAPPHSPSTQVKLTLLSGYVRFGSLDRTRMLLGRCIRLSPHDALYAVGFHTHTTVPENQSLLHCFQKQNRKLERMQSGCTCGKSHDRWKLNVEQSISGGQKHREFSSERFVSCIGSRQYSVQGS